MYIILLSVFFLKKIVLCKVFFENSRICENNIIDIEVAKILIMY